MSIPRRRIFSRRNQPRRSFRLPIGLFLVILTIGLCVFIPILIPFRPLNPSDESVPNGSLPTALPSFTPPPKPTKEHIGRLIYTCTRGDFNQLCMINADGSGFQQLTSLE